MLPLAAPVVVVVPDFILGSEVAPGPTLPESDAPGAGWLCAEAMDVAPNRGGDGSGKCKPGPHE